MRPVDERGEPVNLGEFNGWEIYPMPMFATISVHDVAGITQWYRNALGFGVVFQAPTMGGQPAMVHLRRRKYQDILVVPAAPASAQPPATLTLSFHAEDLDSLAEAARAAVPMGASAIEGPVETPWNTRDLRVTDPAGHRLVFTSHNANADPAQVERMRKFLEAGKRSGK
ncbi:MAG: VOC family protein [Acidobacteria bacterium]|nr:VOC family protein [Acidobacteriota bacterium]